MGCMKNTLAPLTARRVLTMRGVSGSTLEHVQTGDDRVAAFLMKRHTTWMQWFEHEVDTRYRGTGGTLEILADVLQEGCKDPKCFGLAFAHGFSPHETPQPYVIAAIQKEHLRTFLEQLAVAMGLQHTDTTAATALLIIERTILEIQRTGSMEETKTARMLLRCLQHAY